MVGPYPKMPPQPHVSRDAAAEVWPVHCWVASLLSMDAMSFAMFPQCGRCGLLSVGASQGVVC